MNDENAADLAKKKEKEQEKAARLLKVGQFLPFGLFGSRYLRKFPKITVPASDTEYLVAQEHSDADEASLFERIARAFVKDTSELDALSGSTQPEFQDPHWGLSLIHI